MIIPVKCYTCGEILGDKYQYYLREVRKRKLEKNNDPDTVVYLTKQCADKTVEGYVMDDLKLKRICCRRHMLTHVDIE
jgi:DNA-directed RNA polymerase subunit N (RpoN/RPB10)